MAGLLCIVSLTLLAYTNAADYCSLKSCSGHTMCRYRSPSPAAKCVPYEVTSLTPQEKREVLDLHNSLRQRVASGQETMGFSGGQPAGKIGNLVWDAELEQIAQRWANQCNFNHDGCRDVERFPVGQNIALQMDPDGYDTKLTDLVQMWYDEVRIFDSRLVSSYQFNAKIGHYSQMVWAKTTHLGCGVIKYKIENSWYTTYLVCNYGPAGNYAGEPVYETS